MGFMDSYKRYDTSNGFGSRKEWKRAFNTRMTGEEAEEIIREQAKRGNSPWDILELTPGATQAEIKAAYRRLISIWHPDRNPAPNAEEMAKMIIAAYEKLKK